MITSISAVELINLVLNMFGITALMGAVWFLSSLATSVREIKDNHLPHIYDELKYLRKRVDEDRDRD